jgi:DNA-binding transcriptional ArsR family regulator
MQEEKLVLDKKSFGALAVDSRVNILKALRERRKTLSELSQELKLSISSTKEHLQKLEDAQLIKKMEEGHKWKYYELTNKGEKIVSPNTEVRVWILLAISAIAFIYSALMMYSPLTNFSMEASAPIAQSPRADAGIDSAKSFAIEANESAAPLSEATYEATNGAVDALNFMDLLPLILLVLSGLIVCVCAYYLLFKRK